MTGQLNELSAGMKDLFGVQARRRLHAPAVVVEAGCGSGYDEVGVPLFERSGSFAEESEFHRLPERAVVTGPDVDPSGPPTRRDQGRS
ncbi:hypothetical protein GCM10010207_65040 [Streptomyces atratus]|uniref:hypothetical protein n=1 Tax=Streptomyces atratus TaxID=1893 RepID=UPI0016707090|nr:hypothetical protein [Streptomyces atratus]GGT55969.1 hypothetical protein GCM10010207_65040 [Streptomyces atratus]